MNNQANLECPGYWMIENGKVYICWMIVCVDHLEELRTKKVIQVEFSQIQLSE